MTLAQDQETSIVYGMPKKAFKIGAVKQVLALPDISSQLTDLFADKKRIA